MPQDSTYRGGGVSRFRLGLVVVLAAVVLAVTFLFLSGTFTGEDYLKDFVLQQLEQSLGRKIDVRRVKVVLFPRVRVELSDVVIHDRESDEALLSAKRVDLVLRLIPLFKKQVVGKRLTIEQPVLTLRRSESGHWNVLDGGEHDDESEPETGHSTPSVRRILRHLTGSME
jgi:uncharacterized protein involved in outer membrane biogenesis